MGASPLIFVFLAALSVAVFAFLSIVVWVHGQSAERKERDRFAVLKAVAENPGENAEKVLAYLREEDQAKRARKKAEERKGFLTGGLACIACGIGLWVMLPTLPGLGLMLVLIGAVFIPFGIAWSRSVAGDSSSR